MESGGEEREARVVGGLTREYCDKVLAACRLMAIRACANLAELSLSEPLKKTF